MMSSSLVIFVAIIVIGLSVEYGLVDLGNETELTVEINALPRLGDIIPLDVTIQLTNRRDRVLELNAPSPCKVFKWLLLDSNREFVQAKPEETCPQVVMQATLEGNHNTTENFVLNIDARRLRADSSYELHVSYWDIQTTQKVNLNLGAGQ